VSRKPKAIPVAAAIPDLSDGEAGKRAEKEVHPDFVEWCHRVSTGKTERFAAIGLSVKYKTLRSWADRDEELGEMLADAHEEHIQTRLDEMDDAPDAIGTSEDDGVHPKAAELKVSNAKWILGKIARDRYGEGKRLEHVGPGGGPQQAVVKLELADIEQLAKGDGT
jgi:hypothetical protein